MLSGAMTFCYKKKSGFSLEAKCCSELLQKSVSLEVVVVLLNVFILVYFYLNNGK